MANRLLNFSRNSLFQLLSKRNIIQRRFKSVEPDELDKPIKYSESEASKWTARQSFGSPSTSEPPWYQLYSVTGSVAIFLIYFCILREENDVDIGLSRTLYDHINGLEEAQLRVALQYNKEHGIKTDDIENRIAELERIKASLG